MAAMTPTGAPVTFAPSDAPTVRAVPLSTLKPSPWNPRQLRDKRFKERSRTRITAGFRYIGPALEQAEAQALYAA